MQNSQQFTTLQANSKSGAIKWILKFSICTVLLFSAFRYCPIRPYYNHTSSMPEGFYLINRLATSYPKGSLVMACITKNDYAAIALTRGYLRAEKYSCSNGTEFLLKKVVGVPGDYVSIKNRNIYVNNTKIDNSQILGQDRESNSLKSALQVGEIPPHEYLLVGTSPISFDSRYFGLVNEKDIKASAKKL